MRTPVIGLLRCYQLLVSPLIGPRCRYYPSCSHYTIEAVRVHGVGRGCYFGVQRVLRCHPWRVGGFDPVPPRVPMDDP
ncbi:MAG: membrane protein insertion efficiency factor YidD [Nitrococcus sp.]|nr:membrane protein insertion efficiency factor YidD [Nitrococcus sp.]